MSEWLHPKLRLLYSYKDINILTIYDYNLQSLEITKYFSIRPTNSIEVSNSRGTYCISTTDDNYSSKLEKLNKEQVYEAMTEKFNNAIEKKYLDEYFYFENNLSLKFKDNYEIKIDKNKFQTSLLFNVIENNKIYHYASISYDIEKNNYKFYYNFIEYKKFDTYQELTNFLNETDLNVIVKSEEFNTFLNNVLICYLAKV